MVPMQLRRSVRGGAPVSMVPMSHAHLLQEQCHFAARDAMGVRVLRQHSVQVSQCKQRPRLQPPHCCWRRRQPTHSHLVKTRRACRAHSRQRLRCVCVRLHLRAGLVCTSRGQSRVRDAQTHTLLRTF